MEQINEQQVESQVTPWIVTGKIDYLRLIDQFGAELIDNNLLEKFQRITGKELHPWLKRGIFFSHRKLNELLDAYECGETIFLYTGRGPTSEALHLGHMIPFMFTKWLQDIFDAVLVIQMADDEKYYFKDLEFDEVYRLGFENAKDIIACGFNPEKTFIFSNRDYRLCTPEYEIFVSEMKKKINVHTISKIFGFDENSTTGQYDWTFYQSAAAFSRSYPHIFDGAPSHCLVAYAIDQDPYFRMARGLADKMDLIKPYSIMTKFLPPLSGDTGKMSSTGNTISNAPPIFMTDSIEEIKTKVLKYTFSGGGGNGTLEDHRKFGGNLDIDMSYHYLRYFELDDEKLNYIEKEFSSGRMSCSDIKQILIDKLIEMVIKHNEARNNVTDDIVNYFYKKKKIVLNRKIQNIKKNEKELYDYFVQCGIQFRTTYHKPITTIEEGKEIAMRLEGSICKNLLLKPKHKDYYYLCVADIRTKIDMKKLRKELGEELISFAPKNMLQDLLNVPEGCATLFAIKNTNQDKLKIIIDKNINIMTSVNFHPLRNDATTTISHDDMIKYIKSCGYGIILF